MDNAISDVNRDTACPCTPQQCAEDSSGYKIGIALVQRMQIDPGVHSLDELSGLALQSMLTATVIIIFFLTYFCRSITFI